MEKTSIEKKPSVIRNSCGNWHGLRLHSANDEVNCRKCKDFQNAYYRRYRASHSKEYKESCNRRYQRNRDKVKEQRRVYYQNNKEKILFNNAIWRESNKEKLKEKDALYHLLNPENARKGRNARRARKLNAPSEPYSTQQILDLYGTDCHICHEPIDMGVSRSTLKPNWERGLHLDHLVPLSKGGTDLTSNIRPSHAKCNLKKNNLMRNL